MLRHRLPLLITGVAGVAGFNAFHALHAKYPGQVVGIRPHQTWKLIGPGLVAQDAEDAVGMRALFDRFGFRSILNCVGNCALKSCELDPEMAHTVNVQSALVLAELAGRHEARLVHLSSDLVFSGKSSPRPLAKGLSGYFETDPTDPVTIYGKTMVQAEDVFRTLTPKAAILRISLPMGPSFNHHAGAIDWIQSRFRANRPATLYFDEIRSCTYCDDLNAVFEKFVQSSKTKTGSGGTGLGLSICREIILAHSGRIWVENNSGAGASFHFLLPRTQSALTAALKDRPGMREAA